MPTAKSFVQEAIHVYRMYQSGHYSDRQKYNAYNCIISKLCDESSIFWDKRTQLPQETPRNISL